jgi:hypothetical protein
LTAGGIRAAAFAASRICLCLNLSNGEAVTTGLLTGESAVTRHRTNVTDGEALVAVVVAVEGMMNAKGERRHIKAMVLNVLTFKSLLAILLFIQSSQEDECQQQS